MCGILGTCIGQIPPSMVESVINRGPRRFSAIVPGRGKFFLENPPLSKVLQLLDIARRTDFPFELCHAQAPTSRLVNDEWHPFSFAGMQVATNGVIHEPEKVALPLGYPRYYNDCAVLLGLAAWDVSYWGRWLQDQITGTFASWILRDGNIYLMRWANPLYFSNAYFSSERFDGAVELPEGEIRLWPQNKIVGRFELKWHPYK